MTAADDSLEYFFHCFSDKIMLDISCESSARQRMHMKHQALFSLKDKSKTNKSVVCCNLVWRFKGLCNSTSMSQATLLMQYPCARAVGFGHTYTMH